MFRRAECSGESPRLQRRQRAADRVGSPDRRSGDDELRGQRERTCRWQCPHDRALARRRRTARDLYRQRHRCECLWIGDDGESERDGSVGSSKFKVQSSKRLVEQFAGKKLFKLEVAS